MMRASSSLGSYPNNAKPRCRDGVQSRATDGAERKAKVMLPESPKQETPYVSLSRNRVQTGRFIELAELATDCNCRFFVDVRIETEDGERVTTVRGPLNGLNGWKAFCRACLAVGLAIDPASEPDDWSGCVFAAIRNHETKRGAR